MQRVVVVISRVVFGSFCVALAGQGNEQVLLRAGQSDKVKHIVVDVREQNRVLRICNAFTSSQALKIKNLRTHANVGNLEYKMCEDFEMALEEGDQVQFSAETPTPLDVGTFEVAGIPKGNTPLLLVVTNKKNHYTTAAFKSHAFGDPTAGSAQIAVVDAFVGENATMHSLHIKDVVSQVKTKVNAAENLPFNAVISVSPGVYNVELSGSNEAPAVATALLDAGQAINYVVMRVGGTGGAPEEVVVFPQKSAALRTTFGLLSILVISLLQ